MSEKPTWTLAESKARLSEVLERAQDMPQVVTRRGKPLAVIVSIEEWERKTRRRGTLSEFFQNSPLRGNDVDLERVRSGARDVDLE